MSQEPYADAAAAITVLQETTTLGTPGTLKALRAARSLGQAAEAITAQEVAAARTSGASWPQIGAALGITKQGAQQRYGR